MDLITSPATVGYSPTSTSVVHNAAVSLTERAPASIVHLVQYDTTIPIVAVELTANGQPYTVPGGAAVNVRMKKPDGHFVYDPALGLSDDSQTAYIGVTLQMTAAFGKATPIIEIVVDGNVAATGTFMLDIDENQVPESAIESTDEFLTIQQILAQVQAAAKIVSDNEEGIQYIANNQENISAVVANGENITAVGQSIDNVNAVGTNIADVQTAAQNIEAIKNAPTAAENAAASATLSESWAVGGTGTREGENTNNAKYWCNQAQTVAQGALGWYESESALQAAHPTGQNGQWAIVGTTDTIWTWDSDTNTWINSGNKTDLSDYYTKEQADAAFATAAQGNLANSAVQTVNGKSGKEVQLTYSDVGSPAVAKVLPNVIEAGLPGIRSLEYTKQDLLVVNLSDLQAEQNTPMFFGSDSPSTDLINSPYTSGPFYGYRQVLASKNSVGLHLLMVVIIETYPVQGRIWGNAYDTSISNWLGWKQGGASAASLFDEMAAAYNEGVSSV